MWGAGGEGDKEATTVIKSFRDLQSVRAVLVPSWRAKLSVACIHIPTYVYDEESKMRKGKLETSSCSFKTREINGPIVGYVPPRIYIY